MSGYFEYDVLKKAFFTMSVFTTLAYYYFLSNPLTLEFWFKSRYNKAMQNIRGNKNARLIIIVVLILVAAYLLYSVW